MAQRRALDDTANLLDLYLYQAGSSEVPAKFHLWAGLSALAACVSSRVHYCKLGKPLAPNLYVFLLAPSGLGKGEAISAALDLLAENHRVNVYHGKTTGPALLDWMAMPSKTKAVPHAHTYLVTPELSFSVGRGDQADTLIKQMTEMFSGSMVPMQEQTRQSGSLRIKGYCLNWLAGTVREWLLESVSKEAITGGFFGRAVAIHHDYDFSRRILDPVYPPDRDEVRAFIRARLKALSHLAGAFTIAPRAKSIEEVWYGERAEPADLQLAPAWRRQHDLVLKLGMILALADGAGWSRELVIEAEHMVQAQRLAEAALREMPKLLAYASTTPETKGIVLAADHLRTKERVTHSDLLKYLSNRGLNAEQMRVAMDTLIQSKRALRVTDRRGASYVWTERKRMPTLAADGAGPQEAPG